MTGTDETGPGPDGTARASDDDRPPGRSISRRAILVGGVIGGAALGAHASFREPRDTALEAAIADQLAQLDATVIWLDDPIPGPLPSQFAALRDVWWAASIPWVITVQTADHTEWLRRPADTFFEHVQLGPLTDDDAAMMLRLRAKDLAAPFDSHIRDLDNDIVAVTDRMPGNLIRAARAALASGDPHRWIEEARRQDQAPGTDHHTIALSRHGARTCADAPIRAFADRVRGDARSSTSRRGGKPLEAPGLLRSADAGGCRPIALPNGLLRAQRRRL